MMMKKKKMKKMMMKMREVQAPADNEIWSYEIEWDYNYRTE